MSHSKHILINPSANNHSRSTTLSIVRSLKEANQDFEYYPTTESQIATITNDIFELQKTHEFGSGYSQTIKLLDIGAGDGRVLTSLRSSLESDKERITANLYAVEKASLHTNMYRSKNITLLGTEFNEINFISKNADIAFSNPPYSSFSGWLQTLIRQLNFRLLYVVVPQRWQEDEGILQAIKDRNITSVEILDESDFLDADRQARCRVHVVRFAFNDFEAERKRYFELLDNPKFNSGRYAYKKTFGRNATCPFQLFIETELGLKKTYSSTTKRFYEHIECERVRKEMKREGSKSFELVASRGVLWALLDNYERDLEHVLSEYKKISLLDSNLLQELGIEYDSIREALKEKLFGFRNVYWSLLFDELDTLSRRLTNTHRETMLNTLKSNNLDFTYTNAVYVIKFAVDMANELIEESLIDVYKELTSEASILRHYKSNEHVYCDRWRHNQESKNSQAMYVLDYRFISSHHSNFSGQQGLGDSARRFTNDLLVVFKLLGYENIELDTPYHHLSAGSQLVVKGTEAQGKIVELLSIRYYLNGNRHIKFNQEAMLRLNVTVSRLLGWVRNKAEYQHETDASATVSDTVWQLSDSMKVKPTTILALADKSAA
ncbi:class I SAM-dependent methyltransferase [Vibrio harveyi]|uniref:class I SAM-dependent methyltransferase n=1 Tax=Vibrio harveyi TaxID=669 RepID=UPI002480243D|nr:DUF4942 domain-containing protein [Vibrio harveyi]